MCLGVPGRIETVSEDPASGGLGRTGLVRFGSVAKEINLTYVPEAVVGDYVIAHVGFAIARLDAAAAEATLDWLTRLGEDPDAVRG